jgi:hypothetical protein
MIKSKAEQGVVFFDQNGGMHIGMAKYFSSGFCFAAEVVSGGVSCLTGAYAYAD